MNIEKLMTEGSEIQSDRTGKTLKLFNVSSVFRGSSGIPVDYSYSFWDALEKKTKSLRQSKLQHMLKGVWKIKEIIQ